MGVCQKFSKGDTLPGKVRCGQLQKFRILVFSEEVSESPSLHEMSPKTGSHVMRTPHVGSVRHDRAPIRMLNVPICSHNNYSFELITHVVMYLFHNLRLIKLKNTFIMSQLLTEKRKEREEMRAI